MKNEEIIERDICACICKSDGIKAKEIAKQLSLDTKTVNQILYRFGPSYDEIPVLVLTRSEDHFSFEPIGESDALLPVCSGDMLFNAFNEYLGFLGE